MSTTTAARPGHGPASAAGATAEGALASSAAAAAIAGPEGASAAVPPTPVLHGMRLLALASCAALVLLGLGWELWWAPTGRGTLALKVLPLALALPGLWRWRLYTCRWVSLAVWLYVTEGLVRATSEAGPGRWLAAAEVLLSLALFVACAAQVRLRLRAGREAAQRVEAPAGSHAPAATPAP